ACAAPVGRALHRRARRRLRWRRRSADQRMAPRIRRAGRCAVRARSVVRTHRSVGAVLYCGRPTMRADPLTYLSAELDNLKQQGLYRQLRVLDGEQKARTLVDHRQVVNLSSNNYLGLTTDPRLRERALEATQRLGVGTGSVRTIAGTMEIHLEL